MRAPKIEQHILKIDSWLLWEACVTSAGPGSVSYKMILQLMF